PRIFAVRFKHLYARAPAGAQPKPLAEDEHRIQVEACRTLEIFFHQQTRPEVESFAEVEQRSADKIQMSFASDVIGGGIVPAEDVVTLVARQQIHHRYPCVPLRVIVVHTETDIRNPIADLTRRNRLVAPIYRI